MGREGGREGGQRGRDWGRGGFLRVVTSAFCSGIAQQTSQASRAFLPSGQPLTPFVGSLTSLIKARRKKTTRLRETSGLLAE